MQITKIRKKQNNKTTYILRTRQHTIIGYRFERIANGCRGVEGGALVNLDAYAIYII